MSTATRAVPGAKQNNIGAPPKPSSGGGRMKAVMGIIDRFQMPLIALTIRSKASEPEGVSPYELDMATIEHYKAPIAKSVVDLADGYPVLANLLDKIAQNSPVADLLMMGVTVGMQLAENHGKLPVDAEHIPGVIPRLEFAEQLQERAEKEAEHAQKVSENGTPATR